MSKDQDQNARELADEQHAYIERTFRGDNLFVGLATDPPLGTRPTRSALYYGKVRRDNLRARQVAQAKRDVGEVAQLDADRRVYERVMDQIDAGQKVNAEELLTADRHAKRQGLVQPRSSAQKIADERE